MKSKDWFSWLLKRIVGVGLCLPLLMGTTGFAQNPVFAPSSPPAQLEKQPEILELRMPGKAVATLGPPRAEDLPKAVELPMPKKEPAPKTAAEPLPQALPVPTLEPGEEGLVISLPAALRLTNAAAWDITIAVQQLQVAAAVLKGAEVLWLPTLLAGVDYQYHSGPTQNTDGTLTNSTRTNLYAGGAPLAIFAITDAIFEPLAARQAVRAQDANIQTARNDTLTEMAQVYFDLLEAEADLASIMDVDRRAAALVTKTESLAPDYIPTVEVARVRAIKANIEQVVETARQRWRTSSAEVARLARLKPTVVLQPLEPPHMRVTLVPTTLRPEELIPIALKTRPELTFYEAQAEAARQREREERWRPVLPTFIGRGGGTTPPYPMAVGAYGGGSGVDLNNFAQRSDWDLSLVWTLQNAGLGNLALIRQRQRQFDVARSNEYRFRDIVAREVTVAWADLRSAERRIAQSERELRQAEISARQNLEGLGEIKRAAGGINILVIRPQEVLQSLQALNSAYYNYYGVVAEYNRAQFRMYRALGNPAQMLAGHDGLCGPPLSNNTTPPVSGQPNAGAGPTIQAHPP